MNTLTAVGILVLRIALGGIFFGHGAQKLFSWFGGRGISGHAGFLESLGLRPSRLLAVVSGLGEFFGGLGVLFGFLMPLPAAAIIGAMTVAIIRVHWTKGFWNHDGGIEYPLVLAVLAFVIGLVGPGRFSLDGAFGVGLPAPQTFIVVLVLTALVVTWAVTRPAPRKQP